MPRLLYIVPSPDPKKRYMAVFELDSGKKKNVKFGDPKMESYVLHGSKDRRARYRLRHAKDLNTDDPLRPGFLSYFILWGKSRNIMKNIAEYKRLFDL